MKKLFKIMGVLALITLLGISVFGLPEAMETAFDISTIAGGSFTALVPWLITVGTESKFKALSGDELKELNDEQFGEYMKAKFDDLDGRMTKLVAERAEATEDRLKEIQLELTGVKDEQFESLKSQNETLGNQLKALAIALERVKESGGGKDAKESVLKEHAEAIAAIKDNRGSLSIEIKADATYADLTQTGQLDQIQAAISDIVKKKPIMWELFSKIPMVSETYTYLQQKTVVRDAKGVAGCAKGYTSLTKEEIDVESVKYVKLKDTADLCRDYMDDYSFVESRYNTLLNDSIAFLVDTEILNGTNTTTSLNSLNVVSSEFDSNNVNAPIGLTIQDANMADLIIGMATQIDVLGKLAHFNANVALVNKMDWYIQIASAKDTQGRYLDPRVRIINGLVFVDNILLIPHVDVPANKLFVLDTSMGNILDRKMITFAVSDSNGTNFVDEFVTMMVTTKLQFLVENNNANAFMKCSDIAAGITAITKL